MEEHSQVSNEESVAANDLAKQVLRKAIGTKIAISMGVVGFLLVVAIIMIYLMLISTLGKGTVGDSMPQSTYGQKVIPSAFIPVYLEAEERFRVPWSILAAIHKVETDFSRDLSRSAVGAIGHMQFMKRSWIGWSYPGGTALGDLDIPDYILTDPIMIEKYGGYGVDGDGDGKADPMNLKDAIFSAANYLAKHGAAEGLYEESIYAYNHSKFYVQQVMDLATRFVDGIPTGSVPVVIDDTAWPLPDGMYITSGYGTRWGKLHKGLDMAAAGNTSGKKIVAFAPGKVIYSGLRGSYGYAVIIEHGKGVQTLYAHMIRKGIAVGTKVQAGTVIGNAGNTGNSLGAHLHFEVHINGKPVDPIEYVRKFNPNILDN
ncbi:peptidoglycan DD-metalloendopeptidase family protein [Paenibacillus alvei]|uniref:Peptidoglycan DD-metalloendopeptidase family protein n=1 Tax=Paenibacillus alvei TaxID=44250 RepID=A0ABT4H8I2_PAEAL|nr:peptidoglycan DD-metalloendopeptidase family protein [Paenibacillus alvei]EJW14356.1 peptidase, M23 family [Paenibacillus alvei DSM 29]MCY9542833.1 peptidoglycan DD-metalloendopeptidase family protein [Paenibacillus alvei]MCY9736112.1 peptidoglycan DD-metalloendopeptidase family protein [Paenibacillus alvei]MCY9757341.1 peptidoglycan DD-metalloendopeptidase family protein [Paenibacillus alvei]MCY9764919.1 peptidoglycan DD-metalloendopeptidase family protein [Paenibacillus alvei]